MSFFLRTKSLLSTALFLAAAGSALAQAYPDRPVKIIMPYQAGGPTDAMGRLYADRLTKELGQNFIIDNRIGAGGNIGTAVAAKSRPDGYTLVVGNAATHGMNPSLYSNPGYDPVRDFDPIGMLGKVTIAIAVSPKAGVRSLQELIAKSKVARINIALPSTTAVLAHGLLGRREGSAMTGVPYKGSPAALTDLLGDHVQATIDTVSALQSYNVAGTLIPLAVFSSTSSEFLPGVKTLSELGMSGFDMQGWFALFAPKGTPPDIIAKLNAALKKISSIPDTNKQLMSGGFDPTAVGEPGQLPEFIRAEREKWSNMIKASNIAPQ